MSVAINLKTGSDPILALGESAKCPNWAKALQAHGCQLVVAPKNMSLVKNGTTVASTAINVQAMNLLLEGKLAAYSAEVLIEKINGVYEKAMDYFKGQITKGPASGDSSGGETFDPIDDVVSKKAAKPVAPASTGKVSAVEGMQTSVIAGPKVPLAEATQLLQPTHASSAGSMYHAVALSPGVNCSARLKITGVSWSLSVRFEGADLKKYSHEFQQTDIAMKDHYASQHLSGDGGLQMAQRCFGALLFGVGIPFAQMVTNVAVIANKGA